MVSMNQRQWVSVMSKLVEVVRSRHMVALALAGAAAGFLSACSSDVSISNPFQESARFNGPSGVDRTSTGSIAPPAPVGQGDVAPVRPFVASSSQSSISSEPLAPVRSIPPAPMAAQPYTASPVRPSVASVEPASAAPYGGTAHGSSMVKTEHGVWSADGGAMVVVRPGESAATIATRYSVPLDVLMRINGLVSVAQARPGARIVIPVYSAANGGRDHSASLDSGRVAAARPEPMSPKVGKILPSKEQTARADAPAQGREALHFVKGPTGAPTALPEKKPTTDPRLAKAVAPGAKTPAAVRDKVAASKDKASSQTEERIAQAPVAPAPMPTPMKDTDHMPTASLPPAGGEAASGGFRWPVRGRIIEGFKQGANEGINIAVPDGTNVKAADDGVVAYAGNELKGYGNLVLIRHPNGFVTAYANNGEIEVHRGETVKRGQVIAKSGASGNAASPQLHFELRKGQTPVDPTTYLSGG